jgi:hypothetical protein
MAGSTSPAAPAPPAAAPGPAHRSYFLPVRLVVGTRSVSIFPGLSSVPTLTGMAPPLESMPVRVFRSCRRTRAYNGSGRGGGSRGTGKPAAPLSSGRVSRSATPLLRELLRPWPEGPGALDLAVQPPDDVLGVLGRLLGRGLARFAAPSLALGQPPACVPLRVPGASPLSFRAGCPPGWRANGRPLAHGRRRCGAFFMPTRIRAISSSARPPGTGGDGDRAFGRCRVVWRALCSTKHLSDPKAYICVSARFHPLMAATMRCAHCGDTLLSDWETERGLCCPCYLQSYHDGRQWIINRLAMLRSGRGSPTTQDDGPREAAPDRR